MEEGQTNCQQELLSTADRDRMHSLSLLRSEYAFHACIFILCFLCAMFFNESLLSSAQTITHRILDLVHVNVLVSHLHGVGLSLTYTSVLRIIYCYSKLKCSLVTLWFNSVEEKHFIPIPHLLISLPQVCPHIYLTHDLMDFHSCPPL